MQKYAYSINSPTDVLCYDSQNPLTGFMPLSTDENAAYVEYIEALNAARKAGKPPIEYPKPPVFGQPQPVAEPESVPSTPAKPKNEQVSVATSDYEIDEDVMKELVNATENL